MARCTHSYPAGFDCGRFAHAGSELCWNHDPDMADARKALARRSHKLGTVALLKAEIRALEDEIEQCPATGYHTREERHE